MVYCPKCGASLKAEKVVKETYEKHEKGEKHEKSETGLFWALIGGLILVVLGALSLITTFFGLPDPWRGAFFLVIVGILIVIFAIYGVARASRRSPRPP